MRAVGYVRVSTEGQVAEGVSLELQRAKISAWAALHDAQLVAVFADEGVSGARADRPGLQQAIATARRERAALVVYSLSRLSRSTLDTLRLAGDLERLEATIAELLHLARTNDRPAAIELGPVLAQLSRAWVPRAEAQGRNLHVEGGRYAPAAIGHATMLWRSWNG